MPPWFIVRTVVDVRVNEEPARKWTRLRAMVIHYENIDATRLEVSDLLLRIGPAVQRNEKLGDALLESAINCAA